MGIFAKYQLTATFPRTEAKAQPPLFAIHIKDYLITIIWRFTATSTAPEPEGDSIQRAAIGK